MRNWRAYLERRGYRLHPGWYSRRFEAGEVAGEVVVGRNYYGDIEVFGRHPMWGRPEGDEVGFLPAGGQEFVEAVQLAEQFALTGRLPRTPGA